MLVIFKFGNNLNKKNNQVFILLPTIIYSRINLVPCFKKHRGISVFLDFPFKNGDVHKRPNTNFRKGKKSPGVVA